MNERIRELIDQATESKGFLTAGDSVPPLPVKEFNKEKFAELIIRECMDLLEDYTTDVHVGGIQYNVLSADETLQKHFGVERD